MRLATSLGNVPAAIQAMHRVLSWHERKAAASPSGATATAAAETTGAGGQMKACPLSVVRCLHLLLALDGEAGLEHEGIKEKLLDLGKVHPSVAREIKASEQQGAPSPAPSYLLQASSSFSQTS